MLGWLFSIVFLKILFYIVAICFGILIILVIIRLIVTEVTRISAERNAKAAREKHGEGSVGDLIARNQADAAKGDLSALLDTSVDRKDAMKILEWFHEYVTLGKYYAIRENDAKPGEPNYAIVMENGSGYDFKEFRCKVTPGKPGMEFPTTECVARDWRKRREGQLWFYCSDPEVSRLRIDVNDIRYLLGIGTVEDEERRRKQRLEDLNDIVENMGGDSDSDYVGETNQSEPYVYICPECESPYDGFYCKACGYMGGEDDYVQEDEPW